ncbi:MAG: mannitol dehydrogenase family protein [Acidiferrobacterales bacterium]|nr:mannitol dehydrogenase family protein [Acidiferrobacterales bacterium]
MNLANTRDVSEVLYQTSYQREACKVGVVHLGYGAFHRTHQAVYFDDYMEQTGDLNWGIAAVNLRASEVESFAKSSLATEGYLIKTTTHDGSRNMRLVRSHLDFIDWSVNPVSAEQLVADPDVQIITVTVTESGYYLTGDGNLDTSCAEISAEIQGGEVTSVYGYLAKALARRFESTDRPLSILCCDNIRSNGDMLRHNFKTYLDVTNQEKLKHWVSDRVSFPCSMVDRITPRATADLYTEVFDLFGDRKLDPVHAETFSQWVVEDRFAGRAPDLRKVGVEIVEDVDPFEETKIRVLNGGHTALAYFGALAGYQTFDEAIHDTRLRNLFDLYQQREVLPGLTVDLPFDKEAYLAKVTERFGNRAIADQLERICMDGYSKMQLYIRPTLASCLKQSIEPVYGYDCIASWYHFARRYQAGAIPVNYHEPYWDQLSPLLEQGREEDFAKHSSLWGDLPQAYPRFVPGILQAIRKIEKLWPA